MGPRTLTVDELARLFEGRTRFVERLVQVEYPLQAARALLRSLPEDVVLEALNFHPRIGERTQSATSAAEQGADADPAMLAGLAELNRAYETRFGFRFVVFVNRRPKAEIVRVMRQRMQRSREDELATAIDELVAIAADRYKRSARSTQSTRSAQST